MKKYLVAGVALIAALSSAGAFAENFNGAYTGITTGLNAFQSNYSQTGPANTGVTKSNGSATLFNYGLFGGYGKTMGQFYVGGELLLALQTGQVKQFSKDGAGVTNAYATVKERFSINPALRLGALIAPKTLAFVKLGVAGTRMEVSAIPQDRATNTTGYKKTLWGYSFGAGLETLVTQKVSMRFDFTHNIYPSKTFAISDPGSPSDQGKISPRDNIFRVGVAYNFSS